MADENGIDADKVLEDGVITSCTLRHLSDTLDREEREEKLLNGSLTMVCTYPEDYKERQSIYSCLTCQHETGQFAGVCFACSENCHEGHELIQLYTKRLFCCDCGNSKFKNKCKLFEEKLVVNRKNHYNHNFEGKYCTCNKPYPPPEDDETHGVDMYQCFMCEDWFHGQHIGADKLTNEDYVELVCPACSVKYPFIIPYHYVCEQESKQHEEELNPTCGTDATESEMNATTAAVGAEQTTDFDARKPTPVDNSKNAGECYYEKIKSVVPDLTTKRPLVFYNVDWRPMLCRCEQCKRMYEDLECEFLLDEKDSVYHYLLHNAKELEKNHRDPETELFDEIALRTNVDVAHNAVAEIASLKRHLYEFFDSKQHDTITTDDVHTFFDALKSKRRRLNEEGPSEEDRQP